MANKYANLVSTNKIREEYSKINDGFASVQKDVETIVVNASVDPEVALARSSAVKVKDFATLDARIEEDEQDLATHKAETAYETVMKTLYVDVATGNDTTGTGTETAPYKTITKALSSINSNLRAEIKIRVCQGDYTTEGEIRVNDFQGGALIITAFDGVNDVNTVSDLYQINSISFYNNEKISINGIKAIPSTLDYAYGFFASNSNIIYTGCSFDKVGNVNSGFGCTQHSYILIDSCKVANAQNVVSSNYGATVVTKNWSSASINNQYVYRIDNGANVCEADDTKPAFTVMYTMIMAGGHISNKTGKAYGYNTSQQVSLSKDISLDETIVIPINFENIPTWVKISACVSGTKMRSEGNWSSANPGMLQSCIATDATGNNVFSYNVLGADMGNNVYAAWAITSITQTAITLTRTSQGSPTGTIYITALVGL